MGYQPGRTITKDYLLSVAHRSEKLELDGDGTKWIFWMADFPFLFKEGDSHCSLSMTVGPYNNSIIISTRGELVFILRKLLSMWDGLKLMRKCGGVEYMVEEGGMDLKKLFNENLRKDEIDLLRSSLAWESLAKPSIEAGELQSERNIFSAHGS